MAARMGQTTCCNKDGGLWPFVRNQTNVDQTTSSDENESLLTLTELCDKMEHTTKGGTICC